jgi:phosphoribosylformylglycinamidine cyclo-ligase
MANETDFTYQKSGVDRQMHSEITGELRKTLKMKDPRILNRVGAFASLFEASFPGIDDPVLVLKAEEPGSKQYLAKQFNKIDNIGFDMINHLINDIIVMGARPLAVLDVVVHGKIDKNAILKIIKAINQACENQDCSLVGGETSEQPGVVPDGVFILSASVVGVVSKKKIIDGSRIRAGDQVIALASNGLMTNGYSLVRRLIAGKPEILKARAEGQDFIDLALRAHPAYYPFLKEQLNSEKIHGLAHITGDGISGNLERILPEGLSAQVDLAKIEILPVFNIIKTYGAVPEEDLLANLNLGVGMTLVCAPSDAAELVNYFRGRGLKAYPIGKIVPDADSTVKFSGRLNWK